MEWLGGTVSKEDVGEDGTGRNHHKGKRDDDADEEALGAFALRFKYEFLFLVVFGVDKCLLDIWNSSPTLKHCFRRILLRHQNSFWPYLHPFPMGHLEPSSLILPLSQIMSCC
jgi:hypothetical protein